MKTVLFSIKNNNNIKNWKTIDDVVMGGKSSSNFKLNTKGYGVFEGEVSLKNNGGFSSVRCRFEKVATKNFSKIIVKLKGDGKDYQLRIKANYEDEHSYKSMFSTTEEWEEIEIYLKDMFPAFRGKKLALPNFSKDCIEQVTFLIRNNREEHFKLLIDTIELK